MYDDEEDEQKKEDTRKKEEEDNDGDNDVGDNQEEESGGGKEGKTDGGGIYRTGPGMDSALLDGVHSLRLFFTERRICLHSRRWRVSVLDNIPSFSVMIIHDFFVCVYVYENHVLILDCTLMQVRM